MSTRVADRNEGDLLVVVKAKQMAVHTFRITGNEKNFPKRYVQRQGGSEVLT